MKKNHRNSFKQPSQQVIQNAYIESLDQEGRGVAHVADKTVFVEGALPFEQVRYQSYRIKASYEIARMVEVQVVSNQRIEAKCPHYGVCGGCKLQHLAPIAQVAAKQRLLENDFHHIGKVKPASVLSPLYGPSWGYRHKARLSVKYVEKKQRVLVGFNEKATRFVADMNSCEVLVPAVSALIVPLQTLIMKLSVREKVPQIELAVGEPALKMGDVGTSTAEQAKLTSAKRTPASTIVLIFRLMQILSAEDEVLLTQFADMHDVQVWTQTKGPDTIKPFYPVPAPILQYHLAEFGLSYPFKPNEFTQVNPYINQVMVRRAMQLLRPQAGENIADFFCGIGNFTLPIARSGAHVLGLEGLANLVERANESAQSNDIAHVAFAVSDLFKITEASLAGFGRFDKWLVDPPRDGAFALVQAITVDTAPAVIVYVSCNPATLARDAGVLVHEKGYRLSKAGVINMFPHTAHIESIALFELLEHIA